MRKLWGTLLLLAGAALLYDFGLRGTPAPFEGRFDYLAPLRALGKAYPEDTLRFLAGFWAFGLGLCALWRGSGPRRWMSQIFLANALLALTFLFAAVVGEPPASGGSANSARWMALFAGVSGLHVVLGLVFFPMAMMEKPRGVLGLMFGTVAYAVCVLAGLLVIQSGLT